MWSVVLVVYLCVAWIILCIYYINIGRCGVNANETNLHLNNNFKLVNPYRSRYGLQHGVLVHTEQQAITGHTN